VDGPGAPTSRSPWPAWSSRASPCRGAGADHRGVRDRGARVRGTVRLRRTPGRLRRRGPRRRAGGVFLLCAVTNLAVATTNRTDRPDDDGGPSPSWSPWGERTRPGTQTPHPDQRPWSRWGSPGVAHRQTPHGDHGRNQTSTTAKPSAW